MEDEDKVEEEEGETSSGSAQPSKPSLEQTRTNSDGPTPNSSLETQPVQPIAEQSTTTTSATRTPKHSKLIKAASLISQSSGDNGYSTPPRERRVGSIRRVRSGGRSNPKIGTHSRQGSDISVRKGSEGVLRVGSGSLDVQRRKSSLSMFRTVSTGYETEDEGNVYYSTSRPEWGFDQIAMQSDSDSDLEFFDAKGL